VSAAGDLLSLDSDASSYATRTRLAPLQSQSSELLFNAGTPHAVIDRP